jgi:hypothetical protein
VNMRATNAQSCSADTVIAAVVMHPHLNLRSLDYRKSIDLSIVR